MNEMILATHVWHATVLELCWTAIGAIGATVSYMNLRDAKRDILVLRGHKQNSPKLRIMRVIAFGHYRNSLLRLCEHLTIVAVGIFALLLPDSSALVETGHHNTVSAFAILITAGIFMIVVFLMLASILDRRQREVIEELERDG